MLTTAALSALAFLFTACQLGSQETADDTATAGIDPSGGSVAEATAATQPIDESFDNGLSIDPRAFGATPNDESDDSDAFRSAFASAMESGKSVFVSAGRYLVPNLEEIRVERPLDIVAETGAVLDGTRQSKQEILIANADITIQGGTYTQLGRLIVLDNQTQPIGRIRVEDATFIDVGAVMNASDAQPHNVGEIVFSRNTVRDAVRAVQLPIPSFNSAVAEDNVIDGVERAGIRFGKDDKDTWSTAQGVVVRRNRISRVRGDSDANGIKIMGTGAIIEWNTISDVAANDLTDSEGIYTKGFGHAIRNNELIDAGRQQAQITAKSSDTVIENNVITTNSVDTNGIRIEGSRVTVRNNTIIGGPAESWAISTKTSPGFSDYTIVGNLIERSAGRGIETGAEGPIRIADNTIRTLGGQTAIRISSSQTDTTSVVIENNTVSDLNGDASRAVQLRARDGHEISGVVISGNVVSETDHGVVVDDQGKGGVEFTLGQNQFGTRKEQVRGN